MKLTQRMIALSSIVLGVLVTACDSPLTAPAESASAIGSARRETICFPTFLTMGGYAVIQCFEKNPNLGGADTTNNGQTRVRMDLLAANPMVAVEAPADPPVEERVCRCQSYAQTVATRAGAALGHRVVADGHRPYQTA